MVFYYIQPKYFTKFRCIGGDCPYNCCEGWNIYWTKEEVDKLKSADLSDSLKELINNSFKMVEVEGKKLYNIKLQLMIKNLTTTDHISKFFTCPFIEHSTGLCRIQKEVGEDYLSRICKGYPRNYVQSGNFIFRQCSTSCPPVIDMIANDETAVELENRLAREDVKKANNASLKVDNDKDFSEYPILRYRFTILDFYSVIFNNKNISIENAIILGALATKHLEELSEKRKYDTIPKLLNDLKSQLVDPKTIKSLDELKPNYKLKFKLVNNMVFHLWRDHKEYFDLSVLHDGQELIEENYIFGINNFLKSVNNKNFVLRNIIINSFYNFNTPFGKMEHSLFDNYAFFVVYAASIVSIAAAVGYKNGNIFEEFKRAISRLNRTLSHNFQNAEKLIHEFETFGITTPAHLALIIK